MRDGNVIYVVDAPKQDAVLKLALEQVAAQHGVRTIDSVLVSHADEDHVGGVSALLADEELTVRRLYVNAEPVKRTDAWKAVLYAIRDTRRRCPDFKVDNLTVMRTRELDSRLPALSLEVLAPGQVLATTGAGGVTPGGIRVSSNSMSAVIRFSTKRTRGILLAGDIDRVGLDALLDEHPQPAAEVLVFPHHGGLPGRADPQRFAADLTDAVRPDIVVFSHGRQHPGKTPTPRREILSGVRQSLPVPRIACTQLSTGCAPAPPGTDQAYLAAVPGTGSCCAGTLVFRFSPAGLKCEQLGGHARWIQTHVPGRLCHAAGGPSAQPRA